MRLEPRDVRVAEHGQPLGFELMRKHCGAPDVLHRLVWQAIHQIDVDLVYDSPGLRQCRRVHARVPLWYDGNRARSHARTMR